MIKSRRIFKIITILFCLICSCVLVAGCYTELNTDITPDDSTEITPDDASGSEQAAVAALHDQMDDSIIPLAYYDLSINQLIRYNWNIETGEVTDTGLVILYNIGAGSLSFRWDGGSYIAINDYEQHSISGDGIRMVYKDFDTPSYQDYVVRNFKKKGEPKAVNLDPFVISNGDEEYQFDFTNITIPGGNEEAFVITSFYFTDDNAYFLLYPLLDNSVEKNLAVVKYDLRHDDYEVNMVVNNPEFVGAEAPVGNSRVNSTGNSFLVCNYLDGLYEIDGDTYTAQKLYDNYNFALEGIEDEDRIYIQSASYYNCYLLITVHQYRFSDDGTTFHFVVLKDGEIIAKMHTEEGVYLPNL